MEKTYEIVKRIEGKLDKLLNGTLSVEGSKPVEKKVDGLGRVTLPISIRRNLDIDDGTKVNIYILNNKIVIEKSE